MARLYSNENFPLPAVEALRRLGHDVLTIQETGRASQAMPDDQVLAFCIQEGRILVTLNRRHFIRLHGQVPEHPGIVVCSFDPDFPALAQRIHGAMAVHDSMHGRLVRIHRPQ